LRDLKPPPLPLGYTRDWCSEGDSNTHHRRSERRVSADWTTGAVLAGGFDPSASVSTRDRALPSERSEQNGAPCMESNLRPAAYKAAALPTELTEHGAGSVNRTPRFALTRGLLSRLSETSKIDKRTGILPRTAQRGSRICPSNSGRFTLSNSSAERPHARKITAVACATRSNSILSS
jgi:hypothetical protein